MRDAIHLWRQPKTSSGVRVLSLNQRLPVRSRGVRGAEALGEPAGDDAAERASQTEAQVADRATATEECCFFHPMFRAPKLFETTAASRHVRVRKKGGAREGQTKRARSFAQKAGLERGWGLRL